MNTGVSGARREAAPGVRPPGTAYAPETTRASVDLSTFVERRHLARANSPTRSGIEKKEVELPPLNGAFPSRPFKRFYEPDSVRVMTDALEIANRMLPVDARGNESLRRRLALHIMHQLDAGERDPARLATSAVLSMRL
jgi:hypothetical protein